MRLRRPSNQQMIVFARQHYIHIHASQSRQLERGQQLFVRQEIGRRDPDGAPRRVDRGKQDEHQLIDLLVRPGNDHAGGGAGIPSGGEELSVGVSPVVKDQSSSNSCSICWTIVPST